MGGGGLQAVAISACGNFGIVGSSSGVIETFNLQSGLRRRKFVGHTKAVTGLVIDNVNRHLVSGSLDGTLRVWGFDSGRLSKTLDVGSGVTKVIMHAESELVAFAADDFRFVSCPSLSFFFLLC